MNRAELAIHKLNSAGRNFSLSSDGYDDMVLNAKVGWLPISGWGRDGWDMAQWPYVVISVRNRAGGFELLSVCEGDHEVYYFTSQADREAALDYLFLWYGAGNIDELSHIDRSALDAGDVEVDPKYRGPYSSKRSA